MDGTENTVVLQKLNPLTEYLVNVYSVVGEDSSEPLKGTETTRMSSLSVFLAYFLARGPLLKIHVWYKLPEGM